MTFGEIVNLGNYGTETAGNENFTAVTDLLTTLENVVNTTGGKPKWRKILDIIQIIVLTWGISTNLVSALCFRKHPAGFSRQIQLLFEHQCWVDFSSCLVGFLTVVSPAYWSVGAYYFDYFMCYLWHGQILYWVVAANSYYGLVLIAMDRYLAVVKPIMYKTITVTKILIALAIIYLLNIFFVWPLGLLVKMDGDKCVAGYTVKGNAGVLLGKAHAVIMTLYEYVFPCVWFVGLYGQIIYTLKKKKEESAIEGSVTMEKASAQIIKAAIAVTGLFMFTIGRIVFDKNLSFHMFNVSQKLPSLGTQERRFFETGILFPAQSSFSRFANLPDLEMFCHFWYILISASDHICRIQMVITLEITFYFYEISQTLPNYSTRKPLKLSFDMPGQFSTVTITTSKNIYVKILSCSFQ